MSSDEEVLDAPDSSSSDEEMFDSSSNDEEEEINVVYGMAVLVYTIALSLCTLVLARIAAGNSSTTSIRRMYSSNRRNITSVGSQYIFRLLGEDPEHFRQEFRMYPFVFMKLCKIIREKGILQDTRHIGVEEMLALFLTVVGQNHRYPSLRRRFGRSHFATSKNFHRSLHALNALAVYFMATPSQGVPAKIWNSTKFYPYLKDCIGAIDGTHIPANVYGREVTSYRNRHGGISQNVLAACNYDLEFLFVLAGWEGSAHDSRVLNAALEKTNPLTVPEGKYYLVDCGFSNRRNIWLHTEVSAIIYRILMVLVGILRMRKSYSTFAIHL